MHAKPSSTKTHAAVTGGGSALARYQDVVVGQRSFARTLYFEFCAWLAPVPGVVGLALRKLCWPRLFGACGGGVVFGTGVILRHPHRIRLGDNVVVSEGVILDARNDAADEVLDIGADVILANNVSINCKGGTVQIGPRSGIGAQTIIHSTNACPVVIGADVIIGPRCYLVGGGSYETARLDMPIWRQGIKPDSGVVIADNVWLGSNVTVLGDVTMASGSVAAAGSVVNRPVAENAVIAGVPARVLRSRDAHSD